MGLLIFGVVIFFLGWWVTGWGKTTTNSGYGKQDLKEPRKGSSAR
jgi:hypothetical protein